MFLRSKQKKVSWDMWTHYRGQRWSRIMNSSWFSVADLISVSQSSSSPGQTENTCGRHEREEGQSRG